jgi:plastocyanin
MKKIYSLICASALTFLSINANAVTHNVTVGSSAGALSFFPNSFTANVGDVVLWTWSTGGISHNVTSVSVPAGALTFASPTQVTGTFSYTITTAGTYGYECSIHIGSGMAGGFTVSAAAGIIEPTENFLTTAYPNPFENNLITVKYNNIQLIEVFNVVGENIKTLKLSPNDTQVQIDFTGLPSGMYFYRTYNEGVVVETKKIVKAK